LKPTFSALSDYFAFQRRNINILIYLLTYLLNADTYNNARAQLITAEEMCDARIDQFSIMTYLSQFPNAQLNQEVAGSCMAAFNRLYLVLACWVDITHSYSRTACAQCGFTLYGGFYWFSAKFVFPSMSDVR